MATIKDVALRAGVSVTTVSHVVNATRRVSPEGRERVEDAIRELGYVPSAVARSLKRSNTRTLAMLIPNCSNPYFAEIMRTVEDRCFGAGYNLVLCNTDDEPRRQSVYLQALAERRIDGVILVSTGDDASLRTLLHGLKMPVVVVDREIDDPGCDLVETAHVQGALLATAASPASAARPDWRPASSVSAAGAPPSTRRDSPMKPPGCSGAATSAARAATTPCACCCARRSDRAPCSSATI